MAAHFAHVTEEEIDKIKEDRISTKTKQAAKYGAKIFQDKIFYLALFLSSKTGFFSTSKVVICAEIILCKHTINKINKTSNFSYDWTGSMSKMNSIQLLKALIFRKRTSVCPSFALARKQDGHFL